MPRILICDDHPIFRKALREIILDNIERVEVDEEESGEEVLRKTQLSNYDLILLDNALPGKNVLEILKGLKIYNKTRPVLMLSMNYEKEYGVRALRTGADGYITARAKLGEFIKAINVLLTDEEYIDAKLKKEILEELRNDSRINPREVLSKKEYQVMCLLVSGKTVKEIADTLSRNVKTIFTHRYRILKKMQMKNDVELARFIIENKYVDL